MGDTCYYTTGCKAFAIVVESAWRSFVGKTTLLVQHAKDQGHFKATMDSMSYHKDPSGLIAFHETFEQITCYNFEQTRYVGFPPYLTIQFVLDQSLRETRIIVYHLFRLFD